MVFVPGKLAPDPVTVAVQTPLVVPVIWQMTWSYLMQYESPIHLFGVESNGRKSLHVARLPTDQIFDTCGRGGQEKARTHATACPVSTGWTIDTERCGCGILE